MLALLGLSDSYVHDGRVLTEAMRSDDDARGHEELGRLYKQVNAPFGEFGMNSLAISTAALASTTTNDAMYTALQAKLASWNARRDALATEMRGALGGPDSGEDHDDDTSGKRLITRARTLLGEVRHCAADVVGCAQ